MLIKKNDFLFIQAIHLRELKGDQRKKKKRRCQSKEKGEKEK